MQKIYIGFNCIGTRFNCVKCGGFHGKASTPFQLFILEDGKMLLICEQCADKNFVKAADILNSENIFCKKRADDYH